MKRFKNILAVYSGNVGDDEALNHAASLAQSNEGRLTIIDVVKDASATEAWLDERRKQLSRVASSLHSLGIEVSAKVRVGSAFFEIIQEVLQRDHDLVVMAVDSVSGIRKLFFGSTSMHLMRKCPCPVWLIKPGSGSRFGRIFAAVDAPLGEERPRELDIKIMDLATSLARSNKSNLTVFNAWDLTGTDQDTMRSETTQAIRNEIVRRNEEKHHQPLKRLLELYDLKNIEHTIVLQRGTPTLLIPEIVEGQRMDLLVMGTVSRTGVPGFFMGNTAELILRQVKCSVLTMKPEGFKSPVELETEDRRM